MPASPGVWMGSRAPEIIGVLGAFSPGEPLELEFLNTLIGGLLEVCRGMLGVSGL